jgi:hypothetical protein
MLSSIDWHVVLAFTLAGYGIYAVNHIARNLRAINLNLLLLRKRLGEDVDDAVADVLEEIKTKRLWL